jgi:predicted Na+-dependent transporter
MENPIDLTLSFRGEMRKRQRRAIIENALNLVAAIGIFMLAMIVMIAVAALVTQLPDYKSRAGIAVGFLWGGYGLGRFFRK